MYGERILEGGDMFEEHQHFLNISARYDTDSSPCMNTHEAWIASLPCRVIQLLKKRRSYYEKNPLLHRLV
jgi:hypothetical protein